MLGLNLTHVSKRDNLDDSTETRLKLRPHKVSFMHKNRFYGRIFHISHMMQRYSVLRAKFQNDPTTTKEAMNKGEFATFPLMTDFGWFVSGILFNTKMSSCQKRNSKCADKAVAKVIKAMIIPIYTLLRQNIYTESALRSIISRWQRLHCLVHCSLTPVYLR